MGFAFVGSITPGPNNALLLASGIRFGFGRTVRHVAGTAVGMAALILAVAAGIGVLLLAVPGADLALKVIGSAYLLYLAFRIAGSRGGGRADISRPLGVLSAAAFQFANVKAWLFALAAAGTFLPPELAPAAGALAVAATCAVVILGTAAVWAAGGAALHRVVDGGRAQRIVNLTLALLLAVSVAFIWR
ncbi:MAG TPA: LysE family translocator [Actinomycetota bacterium]|nr:LysE family translocator [Actinomycetota bacterium]